jgi:hypothetical protein
MAYNDDLKIARFMVKQLPEKTIVLKYIPRDNIFILYKTLSRKVEYKKAVFGMIQSMPDRMEFIAIYSKLDSFREIYKVLGVKK